MSKPSLLDEVQAAIRAGKSDGMASLIERVAAASQDASREHARARSRALDPFLSDDEVAAARKVMEDSLFTRDRMIKAAEILRDRKVEFKTAEAAARRAAIIDAAREKVAAAAERLKEYPALANAIGSILQDVAAANAAVEAARAQVPGARIQDVDMVARGLVPSNTLQARITAIRLPALSVSNPPIWGALSTGFGSGPVYTPEITDGSAGTDAPGAGDQSSATPAGGKGSLSLVPSAPAHKGEAA